MTIAPARTANPIKNALTAGACAFAFALAVLSVAFSSFTALVTLWLLLAGLILARLLVLVAVLIVVPVAGALFPFALALVDDVLDDIDVDLIGLAELLDGARLLLLLLMLLLLLVVVVVQLLLLLLLLRAAACCCLLAAGSLAGWLAIWLAG